MSRVALAQGFVGLRPQSPPLTAATQATAVQLFVHVLGWPFTHLILLLTLNFGIRHHLPGSVLMQSVNQSSMIRLMEIHKSYTIQAMSAMEAAYTRGLQLFLRKRENTAIMHAPRCLEQGGHLKQSLISAAYHLRLDCCLVKLVMTPEVQMMSCRLKDAVYQRNLFTQRARRSGGPRTLPCSQSQATWGRFTPSCRRCAFRADGSSMLNMAYSFVALGVSCFRATLPVVRWQR